MKNGEGVEWYSDLPLHQRNWADYSTDLGFFSIRESFEDRETQICAEKKWPLNYISISNWAPKPPVFVSETSHNHYHLLHLLRLKIICGSYNSLLILKGWNLVELPRFEDMHKNHDPLTGPACSVRMTTINIGELHAKVFEDSSKVVDSISVTHQGLFLIIIWQTIQPNHTSSAYASFPTRLQLPLVFLATS